MTAALIACACLVLVAAGAAGTFRYVQDYWLYRGFAAPTLPHSVTVHSRGHARRMPVQAPSVQAITVTSPALGGFRDTVRVVLPPGYSSHPSERYPVLYLLHGTPGDPANFLYIGRVQVVEALQVATARMKPLILVMPTGGRSFFSNDQWANGTGRDAKWETFVARDLVRAIDTRYRTIATGRGRGLAGLSEGGYAALNIGLHHPGEFSLLESWSGYMTAEHLVPVFGHSTRLLQYNSPALQVAQVAPQLRAVHTYIWFYCSAYEQAAAQNRAFSAELSRLGVAHYFFERPGSHNWRLWRAFMPQALAAASEHLSHA